MVVGFGENSVDYVYRLPRYPQPGTLTSKVEVERREVRPGGQVTTTLATCARFGLPTRYLGVFGDDEGGTRLRQDLERRGIDLRHALVRHAPNRDAVILLDAANGERVVLWHRDARLRLAPVDIRREWIAGASLVHVDGTDGDATLALARLARDSGLPVTGDFDQVTPQTMTLVDAVTIPIFAEHVPAELTGEPDIERALRQLRRTHAGTLVVTLGARGSAMLDGNQFLHVPGYEVGVVDTTGAGDVFRGAFIHALLRGDAPEEMLRFANAAAAVSCTREGAMGGVPSIEEVYGLQTTGSGPGQGL